MTGIAVTAVGIDTVRHFGHDRETLLAGLPVLFGIHQLTEIPVWMGTDGSISAGLANGFAIAYLVIAFGIVPWIVPLAVHRLEPEPVRRRIMAWLAALGGVVAAVLTVPTLLHPVTAVDGGNHISYETELVWGGPVTALYVVATCGALLASSDRAVRWYGLVNLVVVALLAELLTSGVISLWCVWAAVTSVAVAVHLHRLHLPAQLESRRMP